MAKYIAEIQDASGNTVYPATQWGAITNPPTIPAATEIKTISLAPIAGATDPCVLTVINEKFITLQFNGRYPTKGGQAVYWMDAKYAPKGNGVSFAIAHNNLEGTQAIISVGSNGAVILAANGDDSSTAFGGYSYSI